MRCTGCGFPLEEPEGTGRTHPRSLRKRGRLEPVLCVLILLYGTFLLLCSLCLLGDEQQPGAGYGIALNMGVILLGGAALGLCKRRILEPGDPRTVVVREPKIPLFAGVFFLLCSGLLLLAATAFGIAADTGSFFGFGLSGMALLALSCWMILDYRNRRIVLAPDGTLTKVNFAGGQRTFSIAEVRSLKLRLPSFSMSLLNGEGRKLAGFEGDMEQAGLLVSALLDRKVPLVLCGQPGSEEGLEGSGEETGEIRIVTDRLELSREEVSPQHAHAKGIQRGAWALSLLVAALCAVDFWGLSGVLPVKVMMLLLADLPLLLYGYYLAFPEVLLWGDMPNRASREWREQHAVMPSLLLLTESMILLFYLEADSSLLAVADTWKMLALCLGIAGVLIGLCLLRMPGRLKRPLQIAALCFYALLLCYPLGYSWNLALSGPAEHYPAQVVESRTLQEDGETEYRVSVTLRDGSVIELEVPVERYEQAGGGEALRVCERRGIFGIRLVTLQ